MKFLCAADVVGLIDHALLSPSLTDAQMVEDLRAIRAFPVATVCIKPYAVALAVEELRGTSIGVCTVIGFPHGSSATSIKVAESELAFRDGATEIDMVVNVGKVLSEDWSFVRDEICAVLAVARANGGLLKVIFENDFLPSDAFKVKLCEICSEVGVDFVKTSTGYGFVKNSSGSFSARGATVHDVALMRAHSRPEMGIKASGGIRSLDGLFELVEAGATRVGASGTAALYEEARVRFGR
ncbi:deoxyribose-phosphate aldolase [soil metagenome]